MNMEVVARLSGSLWFYAASHEGCYDFRSMADGWATYVSLEYAENHGENELPKHQKAARPAPAHADAEANKFRRNVIIESAL
jgi:hypothetical protein